MYIVVFLSLLQYPASSALYTNVCLKINSFGIEGLRNKFTRGIFTATSSPSSLTSLNLWKKYKQNNNVGSYSSMPSLSAGPSTSIETVDMPYEHNNTLIHEHFMELALQEAQNAWDKGEVPIGAVIVREILSNATTGSTVVNNLHATRSFQILSRAHNLVETNIDASSHAELLALRQGSTKMQNWRFPPNSTLYTTLEPCPMCLASIQAFRIDNIVYGANDNRLGAVNTHMDLMSVATHPYHEVKSVIGGVRKEECGDILVQFFRERRKSKKKQASEDEKILSATDDVDHDRQETKLRVFLRVLKRSLASLPRRLFRRV
eukprot:g4286.t1 g4286   contig15:718958-719914(-)